MTPVTVTPKPWYQSKIIWYNVIATLMEIAALTQFTTVIPLSWLPYIALAQGIGTIVIRKFFTTQPLA